MTMIRGTTMETIINTERQIAYFKTHNKLFKAPLKDNGNTIDFEQAERVDYLFLETEEFAEVMEILNIFDEQELFNDER